MFQELGSRDLEQRWRGLMLAAAGWPRNLRGRCGWLKHGHWNPHARLRPVDVMEIRRLVKERVPQREIGRRFRVSASLVCQIGSGKRWGLLIGANVPSPKGWRPAPQPPAFTLKARERPRLEVPLLEALHQEAAEAEGMIEAAARGRRRR